MTTPNREFFDKTRYIRAWVGMGPCWLGLVPVDVPLDGLLEELQYWVSQIGASETCA